mgnify:FL=1
MLIMKGIIIGIGKIIPGVSGSLLAISLGVYEKAIDSLINIYKDSKNMVFLGKIGIGILISIIFFSKIILYFLNNYYLYTMIFFIGLMMGNVPSSIKIVKQAKKKDIIYLLLSLLLVYIIYKFKSPIVYSPNISFNNFVIIFILGIIDAITMIVPGISGTALFMMLNCYHFIMDLFSNLFSKIYFTITFGIGVIIGILITGYIMNKLLTNHKEKVHLVILGFTISSLVVLLIPIIKMITPFNVIPLAILLILGFIISKKLENIS